MVNMAVIIEWNVHKPLSELKKMSQLMKYLSHRRPAKTQTSLRIRAVSPQAHPRSLARAFAGRTHEVWK